jgi:integrase
MQLRPSTSFNSSQTPSFDHTPNHVDCPACAEYLRRTLRPASLGNLRFSEAAPLWLEEHAQAIAAKTCVDYRYYIATLNHFFGELQLNQIHAGHIAAYVEERSAAAGPSCINHEINTLKQILECAGLWSEIKKFYHPLRLPKTVGQALEPAQEERLFTIADTSPRWKIAYWCSILSATTTAGPKEISHLHLNDVELGERPGAPSGTLRIRDGLKNGYRERVLPLNSSSQWAVGQILKRYFKLCKKLRLEPDPEHYILPGRKWRRPFDPWRPMGSWKKAWGSLRKAAGLPDIRMYDLRHHAITKLLEDPEVSEQTIEEMAGHALSSRMKKRYSHIRLRPKAEATAKLELALSKRPPERDDSGFGLVSIASRLQK